MRLCANCGPATSISPSRSAFSLRIAPSRSSATSVALGPTDFNVRETTHFGWFRHAAAKARDSLDWPKIFAAAKAGGLKNYFIEQSWDLTVQGVAYLKTLKV